LKTLLNLIEALSERLTGGLDSISIDNPSHCGEWAYLSWSFRYIINGPDLSLDEELVTIKKQALVEHWTNEHNNGSE